MSSLAARSSATHDPLLRDLVTPEGMPIRFRIAPMSSRIGAFLLDLMFLMFALVVLVCGGGMAAAAVDLDLAGIVVVLSVFLLRNFYFLGLELGSGAATWGKRILGLRVIDSRGGPLTPQAIFARNLTRELELFVPLVFLIAPTALFPGASWPLVVLASVWLVVLLLFPLINRNNQRVGDLVGGTLVVMAPRALLDSDVSDSARPRGRKAKPAAQYQFTREQLSHYGIYELQVLERLLRARREGGEPLTERAVCTKIQKKIGWPADHSEVDIPRFLQEFYVAQRSELERRMEFGERKEHKNA